MQEQSSLQLNKSSWKWEKSAAMQVSSECAVIETDSELVSTQSAAMNKSEIKRWKGKKNYYRLCFTLPLFHLTLHGTGQYSQNKRHWRLGLFVFRDSNGNLSTRPPTYLSIWTEEKLLIHCAINNLLILVNTSCLSQPPEGCNSRISEVK